MININKLILAGSALDKKDFESLFKLKVIYEIKQNNLSDPHYIPDKGDIEAGGVEAAYRNIAVAFAGKILWLNTEVKKALGRENGFIQEWIDVERTEIAGKSCLVFTETLADLCDAFVEAVNAFGAA